MERDLIGAGLTLAVRAAFRALGDPCRATGSIISIRAAPRPVSVIVRAAVVSVVTTIAIVAALYLAVSRVGVAVGVGRVTVGWVIVVRTR
jgi:hypothetical protein